MHPLHLLRPKAERVSSATRSPPLGSSRFASVAARVISPGLAFLGEINSRGFTLRRFSVSPRPPPTRPTGLPGSASQLGFRQQRTMRRRLRPRRDSVRRPASLNALRLCASNVAIWSNESRPVAEASRACRRPSRPGFPGGALCSSMSVARLQQLVQFGAPLSISLQRALDFSMRRLAASRCFVASLAFGPHPACALESRALGEAFLFVLLPILLQLGQFFVKRQASCRCRRPRADTCPCRHEPAPLGPCIADLLSAVPAPALSLICSRRLGAFSRADSTTLSRFANHSWLPGIRHPTQLSRTPVVHPREQRGHHFGNERVREAAAHLPSAGRAP